MIFPLLAKEGVRGRLSMTEYFNKSKYKQRRKYLRNNPTKAEELLWSVLKGRKLCRYKIRRQYGVDEYAIDFYCVKKNWQLKLMEKYMTMRNLENMIKFGKNSLIILEFEYLEYEIKLLKTILMKLVK